MRKVIFLGKIFTISVALVMVASSVTLCVAVDDISALQPSNVSRTLPPYGTSNSSILVSLDVVVDSAMVYAIDEQVPHGWTVTNASGGGDFTADPGHVKWFVIGATNMTYTYTVTISWNALGNYPFTDAYFMEGMTEEATIGGDTIVRVYDKADADHDCVISMSELMTAIGWWKHRTYPDYGMRELMTTIKRFSALQPGNVSRTLPPNGTLNSSIPVSLDVVVGFVTYYSIDEQVPTGWTVTSASDGGDFISQPGHVKWVVTSGTTDTTYTYMVTIPWNATGEIPWGIPWIPCWDYEFTGTYRMEGMTEEATIGGDTVMRVHDKADTDHNCGISIIELMNAISWWKHGTYPDYGMRELITTITRMRYGVP